MSLRPTSTPVSLLGQVLLLHLLIPRDSDVEDPTCIRTSRRDIEKSTSISLFVVRLNQVLLLSWFFILFSISLFHPPQTSPLLYWALIRELARNLVVFSLFQNLNLVIYLFICYHYGLIFRRKFFALLHLSFFMPNIKVCFFKFVVFSKYCLLFEIITLQKPTKYLILFLTLILKVAENRITLLGAPKVEVVLLQHHLLGDMGVLTKPTPMHCNNYSYALQ